MPTGKYKRICKNKFCKSIGIISHGKGVYTEGLHNGMKVMFDYLVKNKVCSPKRETVENWIINSCNKRTASARGILPECNKSKLCVTCKEKFEVITKIIGKRYV